MKKFSMRLRLTAFFLIACCSAFSQRNFWTNTTGAAMPASQDQVKLPKKYRSVSLDTTGLLTFLNTAPKEFTANAKSNPAILLLPMPDGSFKKFKVVSTSIMEPGLSAQFPGIKTFGGQGIDDPYSTIKLDWSAIGFHAMIFSPVNGEVVIDPYSVTSLANYISYKKADFEHSEPFLEDGEIVSAKKLDKKGLAARTQASLCIGGTLRKYRLAVACTGEYARAIGFGTSVTPAQALSAIVTSVNRVDGVYETELDIRLSLIDSNMKIVYTNPSTDPFTGNQNANKLIDESQTVIDSKIGNANYDIGHTFSTGAGGLAQQGSACVTGSKAMGVTGQSHPVGDPFDIDFVAHEIGHEVGASHPFNAATGSCSGNQSSNTNAEPGSGSTIMAYAGICEAVNDLQPHSDPQFHAVSLDEITDYTINGDGSSCPVLIATGNTPPAVNAGSDYAIPKSTPFMLTGSATDADGDPLTYSWEQIDVGGPFGDWDKPAGNDPLFRSFPPVATPLRYFPKLSDIVNNDTTIGEIMPSYARNMHFRLTARDNRSGGGGVCFDEVAVAVSGTAGPFLVTSPNTNVTWSVGNFETVTWDVANTNTAPINCTNVAIELSTDGGLTYPYTIMASTPNDGKEEITVPNNLTSNARIRVRAAGNIFFDISNQNFTIQASQATGFVFNSPEPITSCSNTAGTVINTNALSGFSQPITLSASGNPAGSTISFSGNPITPGSNDSVTLLGSIAPGVYNITITGTAGSVIKTRVIQFVVGAPTTAPMNLSPVNKSTGVLLTPAFQWSAVDGAQSYNLQISKVATFASTVQNINNIAATSYTLTTPLTENTEYYWRVRAGNTCGFGPVSQGSLFKTAAIACGDTLKSTDVPVVIPSSSTSTVISTLNVSSGGVIADVNVVGLKGTHDYVGDLAVSLISPSNTTVKLFDQVCSNTSKKNFDINFDDEATSSSIPCPPIGGVTRKPLESLSAFDNENSSGTWTLKIEDLYDGDGGSLNSWGLRICSYSATALPVKWLNFAGEKKENNTVALQWTTGSELNNDHYAIERSADGVSFSEIGKIDAGKEPGTTQQYFYNDMKPYTGANYYRIKQVDIDGHFNYSKIVRVVIDKSGGLYVIYPNPATNKSTVRVLAELKQVNLRMTDALGKVVYQQSLSGVNAGQEIEMPVKQFAKGLYILSLSSEKGISTVKVIIQ